MSGIISHQSHQETSIGTTSVTSTDDSSTSLNLDVTTVLSTQSPDDTDELSLSLSATGDAVGEDTLTIAAIVAEADGNGVVATIDADAEAIAVSQSDAGEGTLAIALTDGFLSSGSELVFSSLVETSLEEVNPDGSLSIATSDTNVFAVDLDLSEVGGVGSDVAVAPGLDQVSDDEDLPDPMSGTSSDDGSPETPGVDGNIALIAVDVAVFGDESFAAVDAFAITIEDELSTSVVFAELALTV